MSERQASRNGSRPGSRSFRFWQKKPTQQEKMKVCNKDAGEKKLAGVERKAFMKDCLSK
jgi:hypothetical protein